MSFVVVVVVVVAVVVVANVVVVVFVTCCYCWGDVLQKWCATMKMPAPQSEAPMTRYTTLQKSLSSEVMSVRLFVIVVSVSLLLLLLLFTSSLRKVGAEW